MKSRRYSSDNLLATKVEKIFLEHRQSLDEFLASQKNNICKIVTVITRALKKNKKVILFGNGGSAADSQHIAAELIGRFKKERKPLPAVALSCNTSILTAVGNDLGFKYIFLRQIEAIGNAGDVALGISTSGNSENVILAIKTAKRMGLFAVGLTGCKGGRLASMVDLAIIVPSFNIPRIQEMHILTGHVICELIEEQIFKK